MELDDTLVEKLDKDSVRMLIITLGNRLGVSMISFCMVMALSFDRIATIGLGFHKRKGPSIGLAPY